MANKKISQLSPATTLTGVEIVPITQGTSTVKTTVQDIANLVPASPTELPTQIGGDANKFLQADGIGGVSYQTAGASYKKYAAVIKQNANNQITVVSTLINEIGVVTYSRLGVGKYVMHCEAFQYNKTFVNRLNAFGDSFPVGSQETQYNLIENFGGAGPFNMCAVYQHYYLSSSKNIGFDFKNGGSVLVDNYLDYDYYFEVLLYP